jgi:TolA-binding protein
MRGRRIEFLIIFLLFTFLIANFQFPISNFQLQITDYEASAQVDLQQLKQNYFSQHKYSEFVDYLKSIREQNPAKASYYIALSRYEQLRYLEETQNWEEYFNRGEDYRREFNREAYKALELASEGNPVSIYARCLLWQFHSDMQDEQQEEALRDLLSVVKQYSELPDADLTAIKFVADKLSNYGERIDSQKVYKIYLERMIATLSENKESNLISLAKELAFSEDGRGNPFFAEEVFKKLEGISPDFILDEQTQYLRAYNLEKSKQYEDAYRQYRILADNYPRTSHYKEALFKMGVICAYVLTDIPAAFDYFKELIQSLPQDWHAISALYQLGLISQYQGDISSAQRYYSSLVEKAEQASCCNDLVNRALARLKEIEQGQALEFNLNSFMDVLKQGDVRMPNIDITAQHFKLTPQQEVRISSFVLPAESGCFPVNLEYFWSGDLGSATPGSGQGSFVTYYSHPGTKKLIQLTVIAPSGVLGRDFIFLNVAED